MTRLIDTQGRIIEIEMKVWNGEQYSPDWSNDFFEVGELQRDEENDAYMVQDVEYCIEQAEDWENSMGDYSMDEPNEGNTVFVDWLNQ